MPSVISLKRRLTRLAPMKPAEPVMRMVLWLRADIGELIINCVEMIINCVESEISALANLRFDN